MPNEKRKAHPILEQLSEKELEELLLAEPDGSDEDAAFIKEIMKVMEADDVLTDADAAWEEFQESYRNHADAFSAGKTCELPSPPAHNKRPRTFRTMIRYIGIAAIVVILMSGIASALGVNVFHAFANWTEETFSFVSGHTSEQQSSTQAIPENDPCNELRTAVSEHTAIPLIPTWVPEGTKACNAVKATRRENAMEISQLFQNDSGYFSIKIQIYDEIPDDYTRTYQKDASNITPYEAGGNLHYIFTNNGSYVAAWTYEEAEIYIQGDLFNANSHRLTIALIRQCNGNGMTALARRKKIPAQ